jgi:hypothetical protein
VFALCSQKSLTSRETSRLVRRILATLAVGAAVFSTAASPALALVLPPDTIDGPSRAIVEFGNVAMAPDGTGGLVYTKEVDGEPHVFVSRFVGGNWGSPIRVDAGQKFAASQPRIAATGKGQLLVVWVTPIATVEKKVRDGLFSSTLGPGAEEFGTELLVDSNVGKGLGVDPSLAGAQAGKAFVAYRVVTDDFSEVTARTTIQLRPGDVMAEIKLARLENGKWSQMGPVNRNPETSMRSPTLADAPQVGVGATGNGAVVWQEPDQTGTARLWVRRIYGSRLGPQSQASPSTWQGQTVSGDVEAFSLGVTAYDQARIAMRLTPVPGSSSGPQVFLNSLLPNYKEQGAKPTGVLAAEGPGAAGTPGPPTVAVSGESGGEGSMLLTYLAGGQAHRLDVDTAGALSPLAGVPGPVAHSSAESAAAAVDPAGGGVIAYAASDESGGSQLAVRQEQPSGAAQTALLSGVQRGPISGLSIAGSEAGEAVIGFLQGEPGGFEVVGDAVTTPPRELSLLPPSGWVRPRAAVLHWQAPEAGIGGGITYAVLVDRRIVSAGIDRLQFRPPPAVLGSGALKVQVLASDSLGQQVLSAAKRMRVDGLAPEARVKTRPGRGKVSVALTDSDSGVAKRTVRITFGDGASARRRAKATHVYSKPGRYSVRVVARDRVGNVLRRRFPVQVK